METESEYCLATSSKDMTSKTTQTPTPPSTPQVPCSWATLCLEEADQTISHFSKILSTPSGTDTILLMLSYSSLLTSSILTSVSLARLRSTARLVIDKVSNLPPETTVVLTTATIPFSRLLNISMRLKALSTLISDVRMFARLWGLLGIWTWGKTILTESSHDDRFLKRVKSLQIFVNVAYQFLENYAYLSGKGVLGLSEVKQHKAWIWSSRFWALHVLLEYMRLWREMKLHEKSDEAKEGEESWVGDWKKQILINTAYAPLTLHWGSEKGLVSEFWVGLLGTMVGLIKTQDAWCRTM